MRPANHYNYNYTAVGIVKGLALVELLVYIPVPLYIRIIIRQILEPSWPGYDYNYAVSERAGLRSDGRRLGLNATLATWCVGDQPRVGRSFRVPWRIVQFIDAYRSANEGANGA